MCYPLLVSHSPIKQSSAGGSTSQSTEVTNFGKNKSWFAHVTNKSCHSPLTHWNITAMRILMTILSTAAYVVQDNSLSKLSMIVKDDYGLWITYSLPLS